MYFIEATKKVVSAETCEKEWMFAILLLTQSLELTIKAILEKCHPLFIYENIDNPKNTVSITVGFDRLCNPKIGGVNIDEKTKKSVNSLIKMRNEITHHSVDLSVHHARAVVCQAMELISFFQSSKLGYDIGDILEDDVMNSLRDIPGLKWVILTHAQDQVVNSGIPEKYIAECPKCEEHYCVIDSGTIGVCYACLEETDFYNATTDNGVFCCERCGNASVCEPQKLWELADPDFCEGLLLNYEYRLIEEYEYESVCVECLPEVKQEITDKRNGLHIDY